MSYGIPYSGSKNKIAKWVIENLPKADNLYDIFGGGGSISHCAILSGKWEYVHYNDGFEMPVRCFENAIRGKYLMDHTFYLKDEFDSIKNTNELARYQFSFGGNGDDYLYSTNIMYQKKALHNAVFFNDMSGLDKDPLIGDSIEDRMEDARKKYFRLEHYERLHRINQLTSLQPYLNRLSFTSMDYKDIKIEPNSIIYCDIPYRTTICVHYHSLFDWNEFYEWAQQQTVPVFISEYTCEVPHETIAELKKTSSMQQRKETTECIFRIINKVDF